MLYCQPEVRMTKHTTIDLDDDLSAFVEAEVGAGRYRSTSEVVAAALRLLEDEQKLERLRAARRDVDAIWDYSARHWGTARAENYVEMIHKTLEALNAGSMHPRAREDL